MKIHVLAISVALAATSINALPHEGRGGIMAQDPYGRNRYGMSDEKLDNVLEKPLEEESKEAAPEVVNAVDVHNVPKKDDVVILEIDIEPANPNLIIGEMIAPGKQIVSRPPDMPKEIEEMMEMVQFAESLMESDMENKL